MFWINCTNLAIKVLPVPGGPNRRMPRTCFIPANVSVLSPTSHQQTCTRCKQFTHPCKAAPKSNQNMKNTSKIPAKAGDDQVKRRMAMHKKSSIMMAVSLFSWLFNPYSSLAVDFSLTGVASSSLIHFLCFPDFTDSPVSCQTKVTVV